MKLSLRTKGATLVAASMLLAVTGCGVSGAGTGGGSAAAEPCNALAAVTNGTAVTDKPSGEITFQTVGLQKPFADFFQPVIDKFTADTGVKVKWTDDSGEGEFSTRMLTQARACSLPDVVNINAATVFGLNNANYLIDWDKKAPGTGDTFIPAAWDSLKGTVNSSHPALPWYGGLAILTYNKDLFAQAGLTEVPKTVADLYQDAVAIAQKSGGKYFALGANPSWTYQSEMSRAGVKWMSDDHKKFIFGDDPKAVAYVKEVADAYKAGAMPKDSLTGNPDVGQAFNAGQLVFGTPNAGFLRNIKTNNPDLYTKTLSAPAPHEDNAYEPFGGQMIAVPKSTKNLPAAVAFAKYITGPDVQLAFAKRLQSAAMPTAKAALEDSYFTNADKSDPQALAGSVAAEAFKHATVNTTLAYWTPAMDTAVIKELQTAIAGTKTPEQALKDAQDEANKLLASGS